MLVYVRSCTTVVPSNGQKTHAENPKEKMGEKKHEVEKQRNKV